MKRYLLGGIAWMLIGLSAHAQNPEDTLAKIKASGKIVIGTRDASAPLAYTTGQVGNYVGYHLDICSGVVDAIKTELKSPDITTEYVLVTSQNRLPLLMNGTIDLECGSTNNNASRKLQVAFAPTTYVVNVRMLVRADSPITSIAQLDGKNVATTAGTTSVQHLRKNERAANLKYNVIYGKDHGDSFLLLESGRADAFVMDDNILAGVKTSAANPAGFKIVGETLSEEPCAIVYRKDDPAFKKVVDGAVITSMRKGDIEKIYNKWFVEPIPPRSVAVGMPMSAALKNAIANPNDKPAEDYASK
ncbi:MAG: transporter substrate-binding domain-containing protein [Janthinobacterium lividum]